MLHFIKSYKANKFTVVNISLFLLIIASLVVSLSIKNNLTACSENLTVTTQSDYPIANSLDSMYHQASYVVIGNYGDFESSWNSLRNPVNPIDEVKDDYFECHIYDFYLLDVVKGVINANKIRISLPYCLHNKANFNFSKTKTNETFYSEADVEMFKYDIPWRFYMEPSPKETVILFLHYNELFDIYYAAVEPYTVVIDDSGIVQLKSNLLLPLQTREKMASVVFSNGNGNTLTYVQPELMDYFSDNISGKSIDEVFLAFKLTKGMN
ncbi:MAG: hypothetical protein FWG43_00055 [Clostridiales bacterium]|nr:hypothetical protein [Clostridiales bacterium]